MTDQTLESVNEEIAYNQAIGSMLLALGSATMENAESFRAHGLEAVADACDELCKALADAVMAQAQTFIGLLKKQGAMEAQIADLEGMFNTEAPDA